MGVVETPSGMDYEPDLHSSPILGHLPENRALCSIRQNPPYAMSFLRMNSFTEVSHPLSCIH